MDKTYDILLAGEPIGQAKVEKQGLYLRFICRCRLSGETMCRVLVTCGHREADLGILVPQNGAFVLDTRLPARLLGDGPLLFRVMPRHRPLEGKFVPLSPETPFSYLTKLENAYLAHKNGQTGIFLQE